MRLGISLIVGIALGFGGGYVAFHESGPHLTRQDVRRAARQGVEDAECRNPFGCKPFGF